ncbi:hypothetical protein GX50_06929 [[Emmonsia] crescens]|uniref:Uncharacterized protein n=1 Tax=[Emmonsia] crescens TaxID=73230 RepID=A0A2B7ZBB4_9EURO|nr:hypothetical protein GX50_06929 [Emmonsia crescens]
MNHDRSPPIFHSSIGIHPNQPRLSGTSPKCSRDWSVESSLSLQQLGNLLKLPTSNFITRSLFSTQQILASFPELSFTNALSPEGPRGLKDPASMCRRPPSRGCGGQPRSTPQAARLYFSPALRMQPPLSSSSLE